MAYRFRYPRRFDLLVRGVPTLLVSIALLQAALNWARVILEALATWRGGTVPPFWQVPGETLPTLLSSHVTLFLALLLAALLANAVSDISLSREGVLLHRWSTQKLLPWESIAQFFATTAGEPSQDIVFVEVRKGLPFYTRLYGLVMGEGWVPGFVIVSQIQNFEELVGQLLFEVNEAQGQGVVPFVEGPTPPILAILATPRMAIEALGAPLAREDRLPLPDELPPIRQAATFMVLCALALPLAFGVVSLAELQLPWLALILFLIAMTEWPLASYGLVVLSDFFPGGLTFQQAAAIYPYTQAPRWIVALALAFPLLLGAPLWMLVPIALGGVAWSVYLVALLTAELYRLPLQRALVGAAAPGIYQLFLYGLLFWSLT